MKAEEDPGVALTVLRAIRGWTRGDLARASGLPKKLVIDCERGTVVPELKTMERLLFALGYSIEDLHRARVFVQAVGQIERIANEIEARISPGARTKRKALSEAKS